MGISPCIDDNNAIPLSSIDLALLLILSLQAGCFDCQFSDSIRKLLSFLYSYQVALVLFAIAYILEKKWVHCFAIDSKMFLHFNIFRHWASAKLTGTLEKRPSTNSTSCPVVKSVFTSSFQSLLRHPIHSCTVKCCSVVP